MNNHMTEEKEHEGQPARQLFSILSSCFVAIVALVTVFAALSFGTILYHAVYSSPDQEVSAASLALADATGSASAGPGIIPASLIIPSLNIDSQVASEHRLLLPLLPGMNMARSQAALEWRSSMGTSIMA
jgi:hypothetical protein